MSFLGMYWGANNDPNNLEWLAQHGWRPTLMDQTCQRAIDRLIS